MAVGDRIKQRRQELGLSQEALADRLGIHQPALARLEKNGIRNPRMGTLVTLACALHMTVDELVGMYDQDVAVPAQEIATAAR